MVKAVLFDFFGVLYVQRRLGFTRKWVRNQALLDFAQTLRPQYKVGMLSNMVGGVLDKYFTQEELDNYFDNLIVSGDVNLIKPQPEMYELAAKVMNLQPIECLLVDDSEVNCKGAELAGMGALLYQSTEQAQQGIQKQLKQNL